MAICAQHGCPAIVPSGRCAEHKVADSRPNADIRRLYRTKRWYAYRDQKRKDQPFCPECRAEGLLVFWTDLDHDVPHRNDPILFWDYDNLVGRCHRHHSEKTGRGE
jgi:5-methylcytosine-specific restriction protein A